MRAKLGEYYTPDWLADRVVNATVTEPLSQRVLDPSCGSGTFVFHAARAYLDAADAAGLGIGEAVDGLTDHVLGMDIHPVAVTLARVTYLLAIGPERLRHSERPAISVPIYLGDSLQWEQNRDLFTRDDAVSIATTADDLVGKGGGIVGDDDLVFPMSVLQDAAVFDRLVARMADLALDDSGTLHRTLITPVFEQVQDRRGGPHGPRADLRDHARPRTQRSQPHLGLLRPQSDPPIGSPCLRTASTCWSGTRHGSATAR